MRKLRDQMSNQTRISILMPIGVHVWWRCANFGTVYSVEKLSCFLACRESTAHELQAFQHWPPVSKHEISAYYSSGLIYSAKLIFPAIKLALLFILPPIWFRCSRLFIISADDNAGLSIFLSVLNETHNFLVRFHQSSRALSSIEVIIQRVDVLYNLRYVIVLLLRILTACINCDQMSDIIRGHGLNIPDGLLSANVEPIAYLYHHSVFTSGIICLIVWLVLLMILLDFEL